MSGAEDHPALARIMDEATNLRCEADELRNRANVCDLKAEKLERRARRLGGDGAKGSHYVFPLTTSREGPIKPLYGGPTSEDIMDAIRFDAELKALRLSTRARHVIIGSGDFKCWADVVAAPPENLMRLVNCGKVTVAEIEAAIAASRLRS